MEEKSIANIVLEPVRIGVRTSRWLGSLPLKAGRQAYEFGRGIYEGVAEHMEDEDRVAAINNQTNNGDIQLIGEGPVTRPTGRFKRGQPGEKHTRPPLKLVSDSSLDKSHD